MVAVLAAVAVITTDGDADVNRTPPLIPASRLAKALRIAPPSQQQALRDGAITDDELKMAIGASNTCIGDAGGAENALKFQSGLGDVVSEGWESGPLLLKCEIAHLAWVRWAWHLERIGEGDLLLVFFQADASPIEIEAVRAHLLRQPFVRHLNYVDQIAAYREFKELFRNKPDMIAVVRVETMPSSLRFNVEDPTAPAVKELVQGLRVYPGVREVNDLSDPPEMP